MPCSASGLEPGGLADAAGAPDSGGQRRAGDRRLRDSACLILLLFTNVMLGACSSERQNSFRILNVTTHSNQGQRLVDARITFDFSSSVREALENGVALTVFVDLELQTQGQLWETTLASRRAGQRIQIHALSKQYRVKNLATGKTRTYRSFTDMSANIGIIKNLYLIDEPQLVAGHHYRIKAQASLDIESLPSPLRPLAYLSAAWQLSSDWTTWSFQA